MRIPLLAIRVPLFLLAAAGFLFSAAQIARAEDSVDRSWVFSSPGNFLGWRVESALTSGVSGGCLWAVSGASAAYFVQNSTVDLPARKDHYFQIRIRMRPSSSPSARFAGAYAGIYFTTDAEPSFDETKKLTFRTYGTGTWKVHNVWAGTNAKWTGTIRRVRLDPTTVTNARIEIASIKLMQDHTGPEFVLKNNWTYADNDTISYTTPSLMLMDTFDRVSDLLKVEFYRRPAGGGDADWVLVGTDTSLIAGWQHKYPALPPGSYDLGVKAYDQALNPNGWDHPQAIIRNLTVNPSLTPRIDVDAGGTAVPFDRLIAGNNEIWYKWSDKYDPATNTLGSSSLEALLADCGISIIRYPGGCHADTFYWKRSIGPVASRPNQYGNPCAPVPVNKGPAKFGLDEFCRWCEARGIEPMITTRFRWPTSGGAPGQDGPHPYQEALDDAVDLVEYCNAPNDGSNWNGGTDWAAVRAANGHPEPYHLKYIEIGNEPYKPDPWGSPSLVGLDGPNEYSLAFLSYYDAIKATDPSVIVTPSVYLDYHGSNWGSLINNWPYQVLSMTGPFIEQAQFHKYFPYSPSQKDLVRLYNETMAAAKAFEDALGAYRVMQKMIDPNRTDLIKIQLNEWNVNYYWTNNPAYGWINADHVRTWKASLATADSLRIFLLNRDLLSVASNWLMQDDQWGLVQYDNVTPNPVWYIFSAFNHHFGTKLIPSKFIGAPTLDWDGWQGNTPALYNIPKLTGMASLSDDGETAYLWVINKDRDNPLTSAVNLTGFLKPGQNRLLAEIWEDNSPDVDDYTTKRNVSRTVSTVEYDPSFTYTFPAHSLTTFKIIAAPGAPPSVAIGPPSAPTTNGEDVSFTVTYSGAYEVTLSAADVSIETTGTAVADVAVSGSGPATRTITLQNVSGDGEIRISIAPGTAHDGQGNAAPAAGPSDPVTVATPRVPSIGAAKQTNSGSAFGLDSKVVTAVFPGYLYIEEPDLSAGVKVLTGADFSVGDTVHVAGRLDTTGDEVAIAAGSVTPAGASAGIQPVSLASRQLGGSALGHQQGLHGGAGLNNVGMLVRIWGAITRIGPDYIYVDDTTGVVDGTFTGVSPNIGVRVVCDPAGFAEGEYVVVTGISNCFRTDAGELHRRILVRDSSDIVSHKKPPLSLARISDAKLAAEGAEVLITGKKVTLVFDGFFYIEELDRSSGIRVVSDQVVSPGDLTDVTGTLETVDGERQIRAVSVSSQPAEGLIEPFVMSTFSLGGEGLGLQPGVTGSAGLTNTGLLVQTCGTVTFTAPGYLYINDGWNLRDGTVTAGRDNIGVRVVCDSSGFTEGDFIAVTGISSCFTTPSGAIARRILVSSAGDIVAHHRTGALFTSIGPLKCAAPGSQVRIEGVRMTATPSQMGGFMYVEEPGHAVGIRVEADGSFQLGDAVGVTGIVSVLESGELTLADAAVSVMSAGGPPKPYTIRMSALGGAPQCAQQGVLDGFAPNNIGLFVRVCGRVTHVDGERRFFVLWDGSAVSDMDSYAGVRVWAQGRIPEDLAMGRFAVVTGISSCINPGDYLLPLLLVREPADIEVF